MAYSQLDISNILDEMVRQYRGQVITYFGSFPGESIVPVAYYVDKLRGTSPIPSLVNNRADDWGTNFPSTLAPLFTHEAYQTDKKYPKGTILTWDTPHIAIVIYSDGTNTIKVFEQNANPDGSGCHIKDRIVNGNRQTCSYALVPIVSVVPPHLLPKGAIRLPMKNKKYYVCKSIFGFSAYSNAVQHKDATGAVAQGNYYIFRETSGMLNLTKLKGYAGYWINPEDNVLS